MLHSPLESALQPEGAAHSPGSIGMRCDEMHLGQISLSKGGMCHNAQQVVRDVHAES